MIMLTWLTAGHWCWTGQELLNKLTQFPHDTDTTSAEQCPPCRRYPRYSCTTQHDYSNNSLSLPSLAKKGEKVRFKAGLKSDKTVRWADVQRERIPIIRRRYTKSSRGKRWFNTGRNSKKVAISRSFVNIYHTSIPHEYHHTIRNVACAK